MTFDTGRLILRKLKRNDLNDFLEYYLDPCVAPLLGGYPPSGTEGAVILFNINLNADYFFGIEHKQSGKLIGDVHFGNVIGGKLASVGYVLNKNYWKQGYAVEAISAATNIAFSEYGFKRIRATVLLSNENSQHVLERCGYIREAELMEADYGGRIDDICFYSIGISNSQ